MKKVLLFLVLMISGSFIIAQESVKKDELYIRTYAKIAVEEMELYKIPASIILAQGILETGNGQSDLAQYGNNHFGIKCKNEWTGDKMYHDDDLKGECFRKYPSARASYRDHSLFLAKRPYYKKLFLLDSKDYTGWAHGLKQAGYATHPKYAHILINLIEKYNLDQFDYVSSDQVEVKLAKLYPNSASQASSDEEVNPSAVAANTKQEGKKAAKSSLARTATSRKKGEKVVKSSNSASLDSSGEDVDPLIVAAEMKQEEERVEKSSLAQAETSRKKEEKIVRSSNSASLDSSDEDVDPLVVAAEMKQEEERAEKSSLAQAETSRKKEEKIVRSPNSASQSFADKNVKPSVAATGVKEGEKVAKSSLAQAAIPRKKEEKIVRSPNSSSQSFSDKNVSPSVAATGVKKGGKVAKSSLAQAAIPRKKEEKIVKSPNSSSQSSSDKNVKPSVATTGVKKGEKVAKSSLAQAETSRKKEEKTVNEPTENKTNNFKHPLSRLRFHSNGNLKYVVLRKGDSLKDISEAYNIPLENLKIYNDLMFRNTLILNQKIYLEPKKKKGLRKEYVAKEGEKMYDIAQNNGISLLELYKRNLMHPGQEPKKGDKILLQGKKR
ncbi:MAG: glucosaminidase domain-containing protein [Flavobacteriaceae bacterium]|jgi:hypothetical protein|nr:glucosaminidase domain-containing protein [Flavobacteriaceae bacterium]